uniref:Sulfotransferase domain-containing protein n=1 Tax=Lepeophtheirus salmonis TaxID=72036 RepID=A0A0K2SX63_LEPSM
MVVLFGRKRVILSRGFIILVLLLVGYWCSQRSILPRQGIHERRILAETTTLKFDPQNETPEFDESEIVDPSFSVTAPTGEELTKKPIVNNKGKSSLPVVYTKKLKDYIFERESHFLVPETTSSEVHFYLFGKNIESLNLHHSLFNNDRGTFITPTFDCKANLSEANVSLIYEKNSIFKDIFNDKSTFKSEYIPQICSLFKIKMIELDKLSEIEEGSQLVFNFRDPREKLKNVKEAKSLCRQIQFDLKFVESLPMERVIRLRFEDLFAKPQNEIQRLLRKLGLGINPKDEDWKKDIALPEGWDLAGNSLTKINKWRSRLSLDDINIIENECREVISKMEYHIVS